MIFCLSAGQTIPNQTGKGVFAAPDYKALYFELFRASEQAARLLHEAQQRAEEQVMAEDEPPLRLEEPRRPHSREGKASPTRRGVTEGD